MKELGRSYVWWPNMDQEVEQTVRNCNSCQQLKKPPALAPLTPWLWLSNPWHRIYVDYAQDEMGHYFILVDAHSRWPEIHFMRENTSATATIAILRRLFAKYGLPVYFVSDNGPQFRREKFAHFLKPPVMVWPNGWSSHSKITREPVREASCLSSNVLPISC